VSEMLKRKAERICGSYNRNRGSLLKNLRKIMFAGWGLVKLQEIAVVKRGLAGLKND
jgi:hypothetical protein